MTAAPSTMDIPSGQESRHTHQETAEEGKRDMTGYSLGDINKMRRDQPFKWEPQLNLSPGDKIAVEVGGKMVTQTVEGVSFDSGGPAIYRQLNRGQRIVRALTPRRWRKSLLIRPARLPSFTISLEIRHR